IRPLSSKSMPTGSVQPLPTTCSLKPAGSVALSTLEENRAIIARSSVITAEAFGVRQPSAAFAETDGVLRGAKSAALLEGGTAEGCRTSPKVGGISLLFSHSCTGFSGCLRMTLPGNKRASGAQTHFFLQVPLFFSSSQLPVICKRCV